jgi:hypothetical protein
VQDACGCAGDGRSSGQGDGEEVMFIARSRDNPVQVSRMRPGAFY